MNFVLLHFSFRLGCMLLSSGAYIKIDFYETCSTIFSWVTNRQARLDHVLHVLSVTQAFSVHVSEWSTARVRVCEGCRNAEWERVKPDRPMALPLCVRHSLSSSGLKTAEKKRAMAGAPLSLFLSLARPPLSLFPCLEKGKKTSNKKRDSFANVQQPIRVPHGALGEEERRERGWEEIKV